MWALGDAEPKDEPFTLGYGYSEDIGHEPYAGGTLFVPVPLWQDALIEYGKRFRPIFEHEEAVGMPPEHLRTISRGLARLVIDAAEDPGLAPGLVSPARCPYPATRCSATP